MAYKPSKPLMERIQANVLITPDGCWHWQGAVNNHGYGVMNVRVHKLAYELTHGPVPAGLVLDHEHCDDPQCCNPDHLVAKTQKENNARGNGWSGRHSRVTHCPQGHVYDEENTYDYVDKQGNPHRLCRTCRRAANYKRQHARAKKRGGAGYGPRRQSNEAVSEV